MIKTKDLIIMLSIHTRNFLYISSRFQITSKLNLKDLAGQERLDILCRIISKTFFLSNSIRNDTQLYIYLEHQKIIIHFLGNSLKGIRPDERSIAGLLKHNFEVRTTPGIHIFSSNLDAIFKKFQQIIILSEEGEKMKDEYFNSKNLLVIGDDRGFSPSININIALFPTFSLGRRSYLASSCITILHFLQDLRE